MKRPRLIVLAALFLGAAAGLFHSGRVIARRAAQSRALAVQIDQLNAQLTTQQRQHTATVQELALAETQLAQLPPPANTTTDSPERKRHAEIATWLASVKRLRQLFVDRPDQQIPEVRFLSDKQWLSVAKRFELGTEDRIREALAKVRLAAKSEFLSSLAQSLRAFREAHNGVFPAKLAELAPYLKNPAEAEALSRYEIVPVPPPLTYANWVAREKFPVDADYDWRYTIDGDGEQSVEVSPLAWIPNSKELQRQARQAFKAANPRMSPEGLAPLIPYFNPPLEPALIEKILQTEWTRAR